LPPVLRAVIGSVVPTSIAVHSNGTVRMSQPQVSCPQGTQSCRVIADAFAVLGSARTSAAGRRTRIGHFSYLLRPGHNGGPRLKLTKRAFAVLKRKKRLRTTIKIVATHDGTRASKTIRLTLRAPKRHR
jgi:hypothetical protein